MNESIEDLISKIRKLVEKYGWVIIVLLAIAIVISLIAVIREKSKKEGT
jgi:hypothetical protein